MKTQCLHCFTGLFLILLLTTSGCNSKPGSPSDSPFLKCWTHAFEEESQDGVQVFRPCATHTFPAARYRQTFTLKDNGNIEYSTIAPNDAHATEQGKWSYDPTTQKLTVSNSQTVVVKEFVVVEIAEDVLKMKDKQG